MLYNPQLETFLCVVESGSFSKAAEKLFITAPAVIKQINSLESSLNLQLFDRTHRGLIVTEAGKSIYKDAKYIIQYSKESLIRAENTMQGDKEVIRVGISPMTPPQFFGSLFPKIQELYPEIKFQLIPFENTPENAREILQECIKKDMCFAFFKKLPVSILSPYQLDDKTFVEYHADPSAKVTLYYALDAGLGNQVKYQTEPLRNLYEGIFAKAFTLFYGETLRYYFRSEVGDQVNETQERVITMSKVEGAPVSKYHMINQMLSARRLDKSKEVLSQVKNYLRQEQYVQNMFVIEKEEQEQITLSMLRISSLL